MLICFLKTCSLCDQLICKYLLITDSTMEMINADINQISFEYDDLLETVTMDQKINEDHAK